MNLKELKEYLNNLPSELDHLQVILQKDSEGNGYSPLAGIDEACIYVADSAYSGDVFSINTSAEDNCLEEDEWQALQKDKTKQCLVIYPIN